MIVAKSRMSVAAAIRRLPRSHLRTLATAATTSSVEFTISPYKETYELGYGRGTQFCMLSLLHPSVADKENAMALYKKKAASAAAQVDELFDRYDTDSSGALDGKQLREAMAGIGLPPTDERVRSVLVQDDANGDGQLQRSEFAKLLLETWGGPVDVDFSTALPTIYPSLEAGQRAFIWVGRSVPTHYVLRALRNLWPHPVESVAIMRNTAANPTLDPALMEVFDETFVPSVPSEVASATRFALHLATEVHAPTDVGGFVVRITPPTKGEQPVYALLRGLPENDASKKAKAATNTAPTTWLEWGARLPMLVILGTMIVGFVGYSMINTNVEDYPPPKIIDTRADGALEK